MNYTIEGDPARGYRIEFSRVWPILRVCPCCDKPIMTLRRAFLLAENLRMIAPPTLRKFVPGECAVQTRDVGE